MANAKYEGQRDFKKRKYDIWGLDHGAGVKEELGVYANDITRPGIFRRVHPGGEVLVEFFTFKTHAVNQSHFDVPSFCP